MTAMKNKMTKQEYQEYVKKQTPNSPIVKNCICAFIVGGLICVIGQGISDFYKMFELPEDTVATATSITLIFLSALLTGLDVYEKIAKFAGAGTLVPITGFANAVVSPALEAKTEGYILGVGAKVFTIAGPVILYGTFSSFIAGIIYYFIR